MLAGLAIKAGVPHCVMEPRVKSLHSDTDSECRLFALRATIVQHKVYSSDNPAPKVLTVVLASFSTETLSGTLCSLLPWKDFRIG